MVFLKHHYKFYNVHVVIQLLLLGVKEVSLYLLLNYFFDVSALKAHHELTETIVQLSSFDH